MQEQERREMRTKKESLCDVKMHMTHIGLEVHKMDWTMGGCRIEMKMREKMRNALLMYVHTGRKLKGRTVRRQRKPGARKLAADANSLRWT